MDPVELADDILYQIGALEALARASGTAVRYVKPHGALYNAVVEHEGQARAVVDAVRAYDPALPVVGLPGSVLLATAERAGLRTVREAFADRAYTPQGTLVPRREAGAVLSDPAEVGRRVVQMVVDGHVDAVDGSRVTVRRRVGLRARRLPGSGGDGAADPRRPGRRGRRAGGVRVTAPTVLAYGDRALLVELGGTERVVAWVDALRRVGGARRRRPGARRRDRAGRRGRGRGRPGAARRAGRGRARGRRRAAGRRRRRGDPGELRRPRPGRRRPAHRPQRERGGRGAQRRALAGRLRRVRPGLRLPRRRRRPAARPAPRQRPHRGARRVRSPWPATTAGSTRASRPAAGS